MFIIGATATLNRKEEEEKTVTHTAMKMEEAKRTFNWNAALGNFHMQFDCLFCSFFSWNRRFYFCSIWNSHFQTHFHFQLNTIRQKTLSLSSPFAILIKWWSNRNRKKIFPIELIFSLSMHLTHKFGCDIAVRQFIHTRR